MEHAERRGQPRGRFIVADAKYPRLEFIPSEESMFLFLAKNKERSGQIQFRASQLDMPPPGSIFLCKESGERGIVDDGYFWSTSVVSKEFPFSGGTIYRQTFLHGFVPGQKTSSVMKIKYGFVSPSSDLYTLIYVSPEEHQKVTHYGQTFIRTVKEGSPKPQARLPVCGEEKQEDAGWQCEKIERWYRAISVLSFSEEKKRTPYTRPVLDEAAERKGGGDTRRKQALFWELERADDEEALLKIQQEFNSL
ncbi:MAG: uncharacterized protein A8A55_1566 [Amphiamblys sp. WSBS2006]|nr:MAG: uncharacterized protein A8A55_1566 [Amphiamblys sp. WSBS2006]